LIELCMKMKRNTDKKAKGKDALEKVNRNHGRTLAKLGEGIDKEFVAEVDAFINDNRNALERIAKK